MFFRKGETFLSSYKQVLHNFGRALFLMRTRKTILRLLHSVISFQKRYFLIIGLGGLSPLLYNVLQNQSVQEDQVVILPDIQIG